MKNRPIILIAFFAASIAHKAYAGDTLRHKYPKVILMELKSEQNRIAALTRDKKYKELEEVKQDAIGENAAMINDFKENFSYCPVYYFMDTDLSSIAKKQFDGILLNADLTPAKSPVNSGDTSYVVVYYGYPSAKVRRKKEGGDSSASEATSDAPLGRGLVINNDKMEQISYLYNFGYDGIFVNKKNIKYHYASKHFDIEYLPEAKEFDRKLKKKDQK